MGESHNVEYKEIWKDEYLKWICGFANSKGGSLFIGIDNDGKVVGVKNIDSYIKVSQWGDQSETYRNCTYGFYFPKKWNSLGRCYRKWDQC